MCILIRSFQLDFGDRNGGHILKCQESWFDLDKSLCSSLLSLLSSPCSAHICAAAAELGFQRLWLICRIVGTVPSNGVFPLVLLMFTL